MPAQPGWFHSIEEILAELEALEEDFLDRQAIERLFGVRQRRARLLMAGLPGIRIGNAAAVSRQALIERLKATAASEPYRWEATRRARVAAALENVRKELAARRVHLPAVAGAARDRVAGDLPAGITLVPGELRIRFEGAEDLAGKLYALGKAMAADWEAFARIVSDRPNNI